jgi:transposase-like protein
MALSSTRGHRLGILPLASALNPPDQVRAAVDRVSRVLDAHGVAHTMDAPGGPPPDALLIVTGGTEHHALAALERVAGPALLIAHPDQNSLPAALEILGRARQLGRNGCICLLGDRDDGFEQLARLTKYLDVRRRLTGARLGRIGGPSDWLVASMPGAATVGEVWEASYTYDVMARVRRVLQRETKATVWTTVHDARSDGKPIDRDELPPGRSQRLLVNPPYDLADPVTGVHLRWVLSNAILQRLTKRKVDPERVAFVSVHADSLHPAVRGLMVYAPSRALRPARGPNPRGVWSCREADEIAAPRFTPQFKARSEALSLQLGGSVVRAARSFAVPVHPYQPVRSSIIRSRSRFVPAVLRNTTVPTAVLIEICNLNNADDRELLQTWRFREKLAHAIAAGLAEGFSR